jgi:membrane protease YdiL (CAAX protease family)
MTGMFEKLQQSVFTTSQQIAQIKSRLAAFSVHPIWILLSLGLFAGITINAVFGFGEELGWRGLLQKEFAYMGFWRSSAVIGVVWGLWHAPIILRGYNYPQHPVAGLAMMIIMCVLLTPIFSYVRIKAKSVIAAAIIHGSFNATNGLSFMMVKGGNDLTVGVLGAAGFIVLVMVNIGIVVYDRILAKEPIMIKRG